VAGSHLTRTSYALIAAATLLSLVHHVDHVLRELTGWPVEGGATQFTYSLAVYPVIAVGLLLSRRGRLGPGFWTLLPAGGALFVVAVHVGPDAADTVSAVPDGYDSTVVGTLAVALLAALLLVLLAAAVYEGLLWRRSRERSRTAARG